MMTPTKDPKTVLAWRMRRVKAANGVTVPKKEKLRVMQALRNASAIRQGKKND